MPSTLDQREIIELLNNDFTNIESTLFEMCSFYATEPNRLNYFKLSDQKLFSYTDFKTKKLIKLAGYANFDCFQFTWFILEKLAEYKELHYNITYYEQTFGTTDKIKTAIEKGYLAELKDQSQLGHGVIFFIKDETGWQAQVKRHMGFYFTDSNAITMISNRRTKNGVDIEKFSKTDFFERFSGLTQCYVSRFY